MQKQELEELVNYPFNVETLCIGALNGRLPDTDFIVSLCGNSQRLFRELHRLRAGLKRIADECEAGINHEYKKCGFIEHTIALKLLEGK